MIWPFSKKPRRPSLEPPPDGLYDVHAHLLPGLDDGLREMADTIRVLDGLAGLGYRGVTATAHHNDGLFPWPRRDEMERLARSIAAERDDRPPRLFLGGEIMFDHRFLERLEEGSLPRMGESGAHLVEFGTAPGMIPPGFEETVFRLQPRRVTVVIAHCERYMDVQRDIGLARRLKGAGALIQMDVMSLIGRYGREAHTAAWRLLEEDLVHLVATDLHRARDLPEIEEALTELSRWDREVFERIASRNPKLLLEGNELEIE